MVAQEVIWICQGLVRNKFKGINAKGRHGLVVSGKIDPIVSSMVFSSCLPVIAVERAHISCCSCSMVDGIPRKLGFGPSAPYFPSIEQAQSSFHDIIFAHSHIRIASNQHRHVSEACMLQQGLHLQLASPRSVSKGCEMHAGHQQMTVLPRQFGQDAWEANFAALRRHVLGRYPVLDEKDHMVRAGGGATHHLICWKRLCQSSRVATRTFL
mmetsp:Transcript_46154/g.70587  ORF Transcript_46154/g.70587 Transcript_46154/m.70587 type:complete len:211 (+) Transcript_46154:77-709(+)